MVSVKVIEAGKIFTKPEAALVLRPGPPHASPPALRHESGRGRRRRWRGAAGRCASVSSGLVLLQPRLLAGRKRPCACFVWHRLSADCLFRSQILIQDPLFVNTDESPTRPRSQHSDMLSSEAKRQAVAHERRKPSWLLPCNCNPRILLGFIRHPGLCGGFTIMLYFTLYACLPHGK